MLYVFCLLLHTAAICTLDAFETVASFAKPMKDMPCTLEDGLLPPELITGDTSVVETPTTTVGTEAAAAEASVAIVQEAKGEKGRDVEVSGSQSDETKQTPQAAALEAQAVEPDQQLPDSNHVLTNSPLGKTTSGTFPGKQAAPSSVPALCIPISTNNGCFHSHDGRSRMCGFGAYVHQTHNQDAKTSSSRSLPS